MRQLFLVAGKRPEKPVQKRLLLVVCLSSALLAVVIGLAPGGNWIMSQRQVHANPPGRLSTYGNYAAYISFDANGIPLVVSANGDEESAYYGWGRAQASQRLGQMEQLLMTSNGMLASVFGASQLTSDQTFATLNEYDAARAAYGRASARTQRDLSAFTAGVNSVLTLQPLPTSLQLLGFRTTQQQPKNQSELRDMIHLRLLPPWQPADSMQIAVFMADALDLPTLLTKIAYSALASASADGAAALIPPTPDAPRLMSDPTHLASTSAFLSTNSYTGIPFAVGANIVQTLQTQTQRLDAPALLASLSQGGQLSAWAQKVRALFGGPASNNFAVDAAHSATGHALNANNPHLQWQDPALAYLINVSYADAQMSVLTIPGLPMPVSFLATHADGSHTSASITYNVANNNDIYLENVSASSACASGKAALIDGQHQCVTSTTIKLYVAGAADVSLTQETTAHGPLFNSALPALDAIGPLALALASRSTFWSLDGIFSVMTATTLNAMSAALNSEGIPLNFLLTDDTDIAYKMAGAIPIRNVANGEGIVPGDNAAFTWQGFVNPGQLPTVQRPAQGFLATSNNRILSAAQSISLCGVDLWRFADIGWRAQTSTEQLQSWISSGHKITPGDLAALQVNVKSNAALATVPLLVSLAQQAGAHSQTQQAALAALAQWNGVVSADSHAAALYEVWMAYLDLRLAQPMTGELYPLYASSVFVMTQQQASYLQLVQPTVVDRTSWLLGAFNATLALLAAAQQSYGTAGPVTWGDIHRVSYSSPFTVLGAPWYDASYQIGPANGFAAPGDPSTLGTGGWDTNIGLLALSGTDFEAAGGTRAAFAQDAGDAARVIWNLAGSGMGIVATSQDMEPKTAGALFTAWPQDWRNHVLVSI